MRLIDADKLKRQMHYVSLGGQGENRASGSIGERKAPYNRIKSG